MIAKKFKYIYGPVSSWRLGRSLGVDPISGKVKVCTFDCIYCQIGRRKPFGGKRKIFVPTEKIIEEIKSLPSLNIDYITFSGAGEPTLAKNLGQIIKAIRKIRKEKIAVLTNSSLIDRKDVQKDLSLADFVVAKSDSYSKELFYKINQPAKEIKFNKILQGIKNFKANFKGKFALQIMFVKENKEHAEEIARIAKEINPDQVQICTPIRLCAEKPLTKSEILKITKYFKDMNYISVYEAEKKKTKPIDKKATAKRRGS